jgi:hypothetical protein
MGGVPFITTFSMKASVELQVLYVADLYLCSGCRRGPG